MNNEEVRVDGSMSFTPEEREELQEFIGFLIKMNAEFRVWTDGYCHIVEYIEDCKKDYISFTAIDEDHYVTSYEKETETEDEED